MLRLSKYGVQVSHTFVFGYIRSNSNHIFLPIPVSFDGLHTWASLYNGRLSVKAEASNIRKVGMK